MSTDTIDYYTIMEAARQKQGMCWLQYNRMVNTPGSSSEERLSALRAALAADEAVTVAEYNWRSVNNLPT
jgi:hypothetical protein